MRSLRHLKVNYCYHLVSRIANRLFFLNEEERTRFVERMWRVAGFSCVEILAYCVMSNHFHILVYVPAIHWGLTLRPIPRPPPLHAGNVSCRNLRTEPAPASIFTK